MAGRSAGGHFAAILLSLPLFAFAALSVAPVEGSTASQGAWEPPAAWAMKAQHMVLMPDGDVLWFENSMDAWVWSPDDGSHEVATLDGLSWISCSGHVVLADGRVLVVAGTYGFMVGSPQTFYFDPWTRTWSPGPTLHDGRYYPGVVTLTDGRVLVMSGDIVTESVPSSKIEIMTPGEDESWTVVAETPALYESYPQLFAQPDGRVIRAGSEAEALFFDPEAGTWEHGPEMGVGDRDHGTAAWLPDGSGVITLGGKDDGDAFGGPTPAVEVLAINGATWNPLSSMHRERIHLNSVLLPDGTILIVGGQDGDDDPVYDAELYDPASNSWSLLAPQQRARMYHSTALLLPDGRVLSAGGDDEKSPEGEPQNTAEVYSPPYLFRGPRPTIGSAPSEATHGAEIVVESPDAKDVARMTMVRLGSVTHSVNFDQRFVELGFERHGKDRLVATMPEAARAPPGWYMLFVLSESGVPSEAVLLSLAP